jgi:pimeloyl-ACP methyl ester carboxylesterase
MVSSGVNDWSYGETALRWLLSELPALAQVALALPLRSWLAADSLDAPTVHETPVVLAHGLLGDASNFAALRRHLGGRGIRRFASFAYLPRLDYQRLAPRLAELIDGVCRDTGAREVDVVGHSLGGFVARYLIATGGGSRIRRLVTLGSPYYAAPNPANELAIFAGLDPLVPAPAAADARRALVIAECGHLGLLTHPTALAVTARYLTLPSSGRVRAMRLAA